MAVAVRLFGEMMDDQVAVLARIVSALATAGIRHALAGGHAVSTHTRPRLTVDVDLLVDGRRRAAIEKQIAEAGLFVRAEQDVLRVLTSPTAEPPVADLLLADSHPVWAEALRIAADGLFQGQRLPVATVPALLAMKLVAATNPDRPQEDRLQDVADIGRLAKSHWNPATALEARRIADLAHPGAGAELERLVGDLLAGRPVTV